MTYYLTQRPTFSELAEMCKRIDHTIDLADKHIDLVSMETGEVYAIRHQCNMWEVCDHAEELDLDGFNYDHIEKLLEIKHKYDKMLERGFISWAEYEKRLSDEV